MGCGNTSVKEQSQDPKKVEKKDYVVLEEKKIEEKPNTINNIYIQNSTNKVQENRVENENNNNLEEEHDYKKGNDYVNEQNNYIAYESEPELKPDDFIIEIFNGILADDSDFRGEVLIQSDEELPNFKNSIARKRIQFIDNGDGVMPGVSYVDNDTDAFLNDLVVCDFSYQRLLVLKGAKAKEILVDYEGEPHIVVNYSKQSKRENEYWAYLINSEVNDLVIGNDKPFHIIEQRPNNYNFGG